MEDRLVDERMVLDFEVYLRNEEKSENTTQKYLRDIKFFISVVGNKITKEKVISYKIRLADDNYAINSINSMLASVNKFFVYLGWQDFRVKPLKVQKQMYCSHETELKRAEYVRLLKASKQNGNGRLCLLLQTICSTGIRISELKYITVEAAKRGVATVNLKGKVRTVFLVRELQKKLLRYSAEQGIITGEIFVTKSGKSLNRTNIWREMKNLCIQAGVSSKKVFPHNLRHLFARTFYGIEKDIAKLADILGHSSINTTRLYIITTGDEHRHKMERMKLTI